MAFAWILLLLCGWLIVWHIEQPNMKNAKYYPAPNCDTCCCDDQLLNRYCVPKNNYSMVSGNKPLQSPNDVAMDDDSIHEYSSDLIFSLIKWETLPKLVLPYWFDCLRLPRQQFVVERTQIGFSITWFFGGALITHARTCRASYHTYLARAPPTDSLLL